MISLIDSVWFFNLPKTSTLINTAHDRISSGVSHTAFVNDEMRVNARRGWKNTSGTQVKFNRLLCSINGASVIINHTL